MRLNIFKMLISIAELVGTIKSADMHSENFMTVEGMTADGRKFHVCLNVSAKKEEEENA